MNTAADYSYPLVMFAVELRDMVRAWQRTLPGEAQCAALAVVLSDVLAELPIGERVQATAETCEMIVGYVADEDRISLL